MEMSESVEATTSSLLTLSAAAIHARETAMPPGMEEEKKVPLVNLSGLLMSFAHGLFYARIPQLQRQMHLGFGGSSEANWSDLDTLCCPSDSGHVALALTMNENDCSCLPNFRTPTARDWKGMSAKSWRERKNKDNTPTLPDQIGGTPHPEFVEELMGFPTSWTDLKR